MDYRDTLARIPGAQTNNRWQPTPAAGAQPTGGNIPPGTATGFTGGAAPLPKPPVDRPSPGMGAAVPQDAAPMPNQSVGRRMSPGNLSREAQDFLSKLFQAKRNGYQIQQEKDGQISISLPKKTGSIKEMMGLLGR